MKLNTKSNQKKLDTVNNNKKKDTGTELHLQEFTILHHFNLSVTEKQAKETGTGIRLKKAPNFLWIC
jgi:hypothetical protein